jgi:DNA-binding CsgD family transcriptional regulator
MAAAIALLRRASHGRQGGVVLVTGEAGMGKSAVLNAVAAEAINLKFVVGASKADEVAQISPGAPLLLALRSGPSPLLDAPAFGELAALVDQPLLLTDRLSGVLAELASRRPVLIAIDDVHWVDRLSLFALRVLSSRLSGVPLIWAFTGRDTTGGLAADLSAPAFQGVPVESIRLRPLTGPDLTAIARDRLGDIEKTPVGKLLDGVGGNPLLAVQIIDGVARAREHGERADQLPVEFIAGVRRTLNGLGSEEQELIRITAVLGRPFAPEEATGLVGGHPASLVSDWIDQAISSGLLAATGHTLAFRHDLVRETIYADLTDTTRRMLHRRCAAYLLDAGHPALDVAPHAGAGATVGDEQTVSILRAAANEAVTAMPNTAADLILDAFRLIRPTQPTWLEVGEQCVEILCRVQRGNDAVAVADTLLIRLDDADRAARIQALAVGALWQMGVVGDSLARIETALSRPGVSAAARARLEAARALALTRAAPDDVARRAAGAALTEALELGDDEARTVALQAVGEVARNSGDYATSLSNFQKVRIYGGTTSLASEIITLQMLDRFTDAETMLEAARLDARNGVEAILPSMMHAQMWQDFALCRLSKAESGARTLLELSQGTGSRAHHLESRMLLGAAALLRGNPQEARARLQASATTDEDDVLVPSLRMVRGWLESADGHVDDAIDILTPALRTARESRSYWPWGPGWMRMMTLVGLAAGDGSFVEETLGIADACAARNAGVASFEGLPLQLRALVKRDLTSAGHAWQILRMSPRPLLQANAAQDFGRLLIADDQREAGLVQLQSAWKVYQRVGARQEMLATERAMRAAGLRSTQWTPQPAKPAHGWEALTETEKRVALLVSTGHTNRSAANQLHLSPNTVGTHLRSIFAKLEIQSRVQLTNALHDRTSARDRS